MADLNNCSTEKCSITSICMYKKTTQVRWWIRWRWLLEQRLRKTSPRVATLLSWENTSLHHHVAEMELSHSLTRSSVTYLEVSIMVSPGFFCLMFCSILEFSVIYYGAFCLYFAPNFFCITVLCPKLGLYLLMRNLSLHTEWKDSPPSRRSVSRKVTCAASAACTEESFCISAVKRSAEHGVQRSTTFDHKGSPLLTLSPL
jgi:hypothetical protein